MIKIYKFIQSVFISTFILFPTLSFCGNEEPITFYGIKNIYSNYLSGNLKPNDAYTLCKRVFKITESRKIRIIINEMLYTTKYCDYMNQLLADKNHTTKAIQEITETLTITAQKIINEQNNPTHDLCTFEQMELHAKSNFCYIESPLFTNTTGLELHCMVHEKPNVICSRTSNKCIIYTHISENQTYIGCAIIKTKCPKYGNLFHSNTGYLKYYKIHDGIINPDINFFDDNCDLSTNYPEYPHFDEAIDNLLQDYIYPQ